MTGRGKPRSALASASSVRPRPSTAERASPAEGYQHRHLREQHRIVMAALSGAPAPGEGGAPRMVAKLIGKRKL